jgi:hypothetical protein
VTSGSPDDKKLSPKQEAAELKACVQHLAGGFLKVPDARELRFQGKVTMLTARCRGGQQAVEFQFTPWVDWARYWGAGDSSSLPVGFLSVKGPQLRGIAGALTDLEYQRMELIKFNLFDNSGTYQTYLSGRGGVGGPALKTWPEMRLPKDSPDYDAVGGDGEQLCKGDLIRARHRPTQTTSVTHAWGLRGCHLCGTWNLKPRFPISSRLRLPRTDTVVGSIS